MRVEIDFVFYFIKICIDFLNEEFWIRNEIYFKYLFFSVKLKKYLNNFYFEKKVNKYYFWKVIKSNKKFFIYKIWIVL